MTSVVSLRTFADPANVPIVGFVDLQREYVAAPRRFAISGIDRALENCREAPEPRRPRVCGIAGESSRLSTPIDAFHRNHKVAIQCDASAGHALEEMSADQIHRAVSKVSGLYADVHETDDWIASTLSRKLGIGKNAGG